jgi:hypothetical protein
MAVTIPATADQRTVRLLYRDVKNEEVVKVFNVDGGTLDADLQSALDALDVLTNAGVVKASISNTSVPTGFAAASNALQNVVSAIMVLTFEQVDPVDATQTITKSFTIPAPVDALQDTADWKPVSNNASLNALINFLIGNLAFTGADGVIRAGGWTYNRAKSGFGTVNRELDGQ